MTLFISILTIIAIVLGLLSLGTGISSINSQNKSANIQQLRGYVRKNRKLFGVTNHGKSMDEITTIRVLSPSDIGIK